LKTRSKSYGGIFDLEEKKKKLEEIEKETSNPEFWADKNKAKEVLASRKILSKAIQSWEDMWKNFSDLKEFYTLAKEENDENTVLGIATEIDKMEAIVLKFEVQTILSGENDYNNAIVSIHPGAGGTESQDWAQMLLRMYLRWAERHGFKPEINETQQGEEAGIKSATFTVTGEYAYGNLKAEAGVHRLVRISPFDANKRRHTSFASVFVIPEIDDEIVVDIKDEDLKIDTFRSGGAGGQHVNVTDSAVRITHIPSGIIVSCQNERSQHKNKSTALKILRSKLYKKKLEEEKNKFEKLHGEKKDIAWGSQIRSYVLHPYRMVKDHRTEIETGNADAVLDGDIDKFIEAYLMRGGK